MPPPAPRPPAPTGVDPVTAALVNSVFSTFGDIPAPLMICLTMLLETQQRVAAVEAGVGLHAQQMVLHTHIAVTVRRTLRAMMEEWRALVVRMQTAVSEHDAELKKQREELGWGANAASGRLEVLESAVGALQRETAALRGELAKVSAAVAEPARVQAGAAAGPGTAQEVGPRTEELEQGVNQDRAVTPAADSEVTV